MKELGRMRYDNLFAGHFPKKDFSGVIALGQNLKVGTLLGRRLLALGTTVPDPANTGNGSLDGLALGPGVMRGVYELLCVSGAGPGTFILIDPFGRVSREFEVGVPYVGQLSMTVQNGSVQFGKGDRLTVEVTGGDGRLGLIDPTAFDGMQIPAGVLYEDVDATVSEKLGSYYGIGSFNERSIILPPGLTVDDVRETCAERLIFLQASVPADLPA